MPSQRRLAPPERHRYSEQLHQHIGFLRWRSRPPRRKRLAWIQSLINPAVTIGVDPVTGIVISERLTGNAIQTHGSIFAEALP